MAVNYKPLGTHRTIQVVGSSAIDVQEMSAVTIPSGVEFQYAVPYSAWAADGGASFLEPVAAAIESRLGNDFIGGAVFVQEIGANQLLADSIEFTVWLPENHAFTTTVSVPVNLLAGTDTFQGQIVAGMFQTALIELEQAAAL